MFLEIRYDRYGMDSGVTVTINTSVIFDGYSDVDDLKVGDDLTMLVIIEFRSWWYILNVGAWRQCKKILNVGVN